MLPNCGHVFHKDCLNQWFVESKTCPVCKRAAGKPVALIYEPQSDLDQYVRGFNGKQEELSASLSAWLEKERLDKEKNEAIRLRQVISEQASSLRSRQMNHAIMESQLDQQTKIARDERLDLNELSDSLAPLEKLKAEKRKKMGIIRERHRQLGYKLRRLEQVGSLHQLEKEIEATMTEQKEGGGGGYTDKSSKAKKKKKKPEAIKWPQYDDMDFLAPLPWAREQREEQDAELFHLLSLECEWLKTQSNQMTAKYTELENNYTKQADMNGLFVHQYKKKSSKLLGEKIQLAETLQQLKKEKIRLQQQILQPQRSCKQVCREVCAEPESELVITDYYAQQ